MPTEVADPIVPADRLDAGGWTLAEERTEPLFEMPGVTVRGRTRLYEDAALRDRLRAAAGVDLIPRFFFATRLSVTPSLSAGAASVVKPTVVTEARRRFAGDLRDRGFEGVESGRTETIRVRSGDRARLTEYRARVPLSPSPAAGSVDGSAGEAENTTDAERAEETGGDLDLDVSGLLAVWATGGEFRLAGGAYPRRGVERFGVDAGDYREELVELIRSVE